MKLFSRMLVSGAVLGVTLGAAQAQEPITPVEEPISDSPEAGAPASSELDSPPSTTLDDADRVTAPDPAPITAAPSTVVAPTTVVVPESTMYTPRSRFGIGTAVGGGVVGFTDEQTRAFTEVGGGWEARVSVGTRLPVAFEAAYIGSAQQISALGLDDGSYLLGNGAEGTLRLNLSPTLVQPYLFGGLGWTHYSLQGTDTNTSSIAGSDDVVSVPFGLGLALKPGRGFLVDLRATGRAAFDDELMNGPYANTGQDARLHSWNVAARLGWEF